METNNTDNENRRLEDSPGGYNADTIIGRVDLRVPDLDRSVQFYEEVVGLHKLNEGDSRAELGVEDGDGQPLLRLDEAPEAQERAADQAGLFHIAFRVPHRPALADALRRIRAHGGGLTGASDHQISNALYLNDPDGNGLEIYCDSPRDQWPTDDRGQLQLATRRLDLSALVNEEPTDQPDRLVAGSDIGHIHLEGIDIGAARGFYADLMGLNITVESRAVLFTADGDYHHHIGVNAWNRRSRPREDDALGLAGITARLPGRSADELSDQAQQLGITAEHHDGTVRLRDPNNIPWQVQTA